ncbi:MAG: hypothetical protein AABZ12_10510 [Planctomycetota bacterium]
MGSDFDALMGEMGAPTLMQSGGEAVVYRPAVGGTVNLTAIIGGEEETPDEQDDQGRTFVRMRTVTMRTDAGAAEGGVADPGLNDELDIGADRYAVKAIEQIGGTLVRMVCVRIGLAEAARTGYRGRR